MRCLLFLKIGMVLNEEKNNMNIWALCKASGIPCSTISTFMSGKTELIKLDTLLHICEGFNITLGDFFSDELFKYVYQESNKD